MPAATDNITIRECHESRDFFACVDLQKEVWQFDDVDVVPQRMFVVADKIGGQVLGAFDHGTLVGFALAIPGSRYGHLYLHSHMLAVKNDYRNTGIGRRLKLAQRERAIAAGFELMEWTFDPLEIKNAFLNIARLGAIARRYQPNQYGDSSSPLQGGLPTDRLVAEWWLRSKRVTKLMDEGKYDLPAQLSRISVPSEVYEWKANQATRGRALEVQSRNRQDLMAAFAKGDSILGYERDDQGSGTFLVGKWDEPFLYSPPKP